MVRSGELLNDGEIVRHIQLVVQQPIATVVQAETRLEEVRKLTAAFMEQHGVSLQNKATIERLPELERVQFEKPLKELKR